MPIFEHDQDRRSREDLGLAEIEICMCPARRRYANWKELVEDALLGNSIRPQN
jgi:hypothetical protein